MRVAVIGSGYVGLVSGACLASRGHDVVCVDLDQHKVDAINRGQAPIHEEGLPELLAQTVGSRLTATTDLAGAVRDASMTIIAVGTPFDGTRIDLTALKAAARSVGEALAGAPGRHTVVVKSTVVPNTTATVVRPIVEEASGRVLGPTLGIGMNPEFLTEGTAVRDFQQPDRLVLGGEDEASIDDLAALYASFEGVPVVRTNCTTAEMIKYSSNCVLALLISFSNELATLCAELGDVDARDVMQALHTSQYFTTTVLDSGATVKAPITSFLMPGCGFGGSCLPKDVAALAAHGATHDAPMQMLEAILDINRAQPARTVGLVRDGLGGLAGRRVAVLGLAFKQDTDDVRESPAFPIVRELVDAGATVVAHDPIATPNFRAAVGAHYADAVEWAGSLQEAVAGSDAIVLVTRWAEYESLADLLRATGQSPLVVDGRRMLDPSDFDRFAAIGRSSRTSQPIGS
jgi:UDPglucose 6-dehydrogenase/GDP-mannose 6-dehydrogenase